MSQQLVNDDKIDLTAATSCKEEIKFDGVTLDSDKPADDESKAKNDGLGEVSNKADAANDPLERPLKEGGKLTKDLELVYHKQK